MSLTSGDRIGPYEISALIGAGGMGEVYRARDTRLNRDIALKILPELFAADPDRLARFKREAQVLASLNHPNIGAIHGFEESGPTHALVLELVEGPTLADRIAKGPIPLDEALPIARQIAEALEAAHEHGVVHRDLKPANIKVRPDGTVKVLDFGLARAFEGEAAASGIAATMSPTITSPAATRVGMILGTAAYMSPEQARGRTVDKRTDIWAFGCVLYEMLTGHRAFGGDEITDVLARVIEREPDFAALPPSTPAPIRKLLRRTLEKDRRRRLADAADARFEIEEALAPVATEPIVAVRNRPQRLGWIVAAALAVALATTFAIPYVRPTPDVREALQFSVSAPDGWTLPLGQVDTTAAPLAISPDGRRLAFVALNAAGASQVWLRSLDTLDARPLAGTEGGHSPFWSPDGRALAFFASGKLKRIDIAGGPALALCDVNGRGGAWGRDGIILINPSVNSPLMRVAATGGDLTPATILADGDGDHRQPAFLPDGRHFLYVVATGGVSSPVYVGTLDSAERTLLMKVDSSEVAYSDRYLLFMRETTLMAQPFDVARLQLTGDPVPVADQIQGSTAGANTGTPYAFFSASPNGVLSYRTGTSGIGAELRWFDRTGKPIGTLVDRARFGDISLSPDGTRVAVSIMDQTNTRDIWLIDVARGLRTRFTFDAASDGNDVWSPDGKNVIFSSDRKSRPLARGDVYQKSSSGTGGETLVFEDNLLKVPTSWSHDGRWLLYYTGILGENRTNQLFVLPLAGDRKPIPFLPARFSVQSGQFSPDGRWVGYVSNESGRAEVYVAPFPEPNGKWQVSTAGGDLPRWRANGAELFYLAPDGGLMAASVNGSLSSFEVGAVTRLFQPSVVTARGYPYDVAPDGQRFLINAVPDQASSSPMTVAVNWTAGLKK